MLSNLNILAIFIALNVTGLADETKKDNKKIYSGKRLKALLITDGCCHNYIFQSTALTSGIEKKVNVEFTVINEGGTALKLKYLFMMILTGQSRMMLSFTMNVSQIQWTQNT